MRFWMAARALREGVMIRTVSSPASVPATSFQRSLSTAAASGCAPPGGVFSTSNVLRRAHIEQEFLHTREPAREPETFLRVGRRAAAVTLDRFHQPELAQIARERGLRHAHTQVHELTAQFVLAGAPVRP